MKKQFVASVVVGLLALVGGAIAAEAQTINFLGATIPFSRHGDFIDNGSSCPGGVTPSQYTWTFVEDGVTRTGSAVSHQFVSSWCAYTVRLTITCPGGTHTGSRFACFSCGVPFCINPATYN